MNLDGVWTRLGQQFLTRYADDKFTRLSSVGGKCFQRNSEMANRAEPSALTLHDLRKLLASVGARLATGDAILLRILGRVPKRGDVLHRHYVSLSAQDVAGPPASVQTALIAARSST